MDDVDERLQAFGEQFLASFDAPEDSTSTRDALTTTKKRSLSRGSNAENRRASANRQKAQETAGVKAPADESSAVKSEDEQRGDEFFGGVRRKGAQSKPSDSAAAPSRPSKDELKAFLDPSVSKMLGKGSASSSPLPGRRKGKAATASKDNHEFNDTLRKIRDLAYPELDKAQQRQYEAAKIRALGGSAAKGPKIPYNILVKARKNEKDRLQKLREKERELGVQLSVGKHTNLSQANKAKQQQLKAKTERKKASSIFAVGGVKGKGRGRR
ncbi:unnamed protein product [Vitrella brassicaformis CCMP3155]|uniref:Uncharacterized protein n=2 Tax=Vitrella brassicaformis TaxID=1169539 RepID=A0A0G4FP94_VITBC|nr:unnamed protein product [Vitrella brassicaformis CCMP3155]|eukprot:CEM16101.1 unnamed protein product [Vitrella brassicaformis CCMP3155]